MDNFQLKPMMLLSLLAMGMLQVSMIKAEVASSYKKHSPSPGSEALAKAMVLGAESDTNEEEVLPSAKDLMNMPTEVFVNADGTIDEISPVSARAAPSTNEGYSEQDLVLDDKRPDDKKKKKSEGDKAAEGEKEDAATGKMYVEHVKGSTPVGLVQIGTPAVTVPVILDTGSDRLLTKSWRTLANQLQKIDADGLAAVKPTGTLYNHNSSKTYVRLYSKVFGHKKPKHGMIVYGSGTAFTEEGKDDVKVAGTKLTKFPVSEIAADSLRILHSGKGVSGILGLQHMKNRSMGESAFSRMRDRNIMTSFGYCRGKGDTGDFLWGDTSTEGHKVDVIGQIHWAVKLTNVRVPETKAMKRLRKKKKHHKPKSNIKKMSVEEHHSKKHDLDGHLDDISSDLTEVSEDYQIPPWMAKFLPRPVKASKFPFCRKGCAAVIDTGSNIIGMPSSDLLRLTRSLGAKMDCSNIKQLPVLHFRLGDMSLKIPPSSYIMKIKIPKLLRPKLRPRAAGAKAHPSRIGHAKAKKHEALQDDAGGDDAGGDDAGGDDASSGMPSLEESEDVSSGEEESESMTLSHEALEAFFDEVQSHRGVDLRPSFAGSPLARMAKGGHLCMPAFVSLNRETTKGPLWVIGTPLFDQYYTRWSWSKKDPSPKIFIKELSSATACNKNKKSEDNSASEKKDKSEGDSKKSSHRRKKEANEKKATKTPKADNSDADSSPRGKGLMRSEARRASSKTRVESNAEAEKEMEKDDPDESTNNYEVDIADHDAAATSTAASEAVDDDDADHDADHESLAVAAESVRDQEDDEDDDDDDKDQTDGNPDVDWEPKELDLEDLRFPHWAKTLNVL